MAMTSTAAPASGLFPGFRNPLRGVSDILATAMRVRREHESRMAEIARLEASTDAELAEMGLTRETITRHVYRDLFGV